MDRPLDGGPPVGEQVPLRRNRDFLLLWSGAGLSVLGYRMSTVAYPLLLVFGSGSTVGAGLVGFAALLPVLVVQLPAGVLVDRWDRRRTMVLCDVIGALTMGSVVVTLLFDRIWVAQLMVAAFVEGSVAVCYRLAERAAVRNVVPGHQIPAALARNEARGRAAGLLGQPVGSALFALLRWAPFLVTVVAHVLAMATLLLIRTQLQAPRTARPRPVRTDIAEGVTWLWGQRFLRAATLLVTASNIAFQVIGLALVLVVEQQGASPAVVGLIGLFSGLGGVCGALAGSWFVRRVSPANIVLGVLTAWTLLMPWLAFTTDLPALGAMFAGLSFAGAVLNVAAGVYQVRVTPDGMQGRVSSVAILSSSGANSAGALAAGFLLGYAGTTTAVLAVAAMMAVLAAVAATSPAVRSGNQRSGAPAGRADTEEI